MSEFAKGGIVGRVTGDFGDEVPLFIDSGYVVPRRMADAHDQLARPETASVAEWECGFCERGQCARCVNRDCTCCNGNPGGD